MSHQAVKDFIRDKVLSIKDGISFSYARESNFNATQDKTYPAVLLKPLMYDPDRTNYSIHRKYRCTMLFYALDSMEGDEVETTNILDQTDELLQKFMAVLNLNSATVDEAINDTLSTDLVEISEESVVERIKFTSDNATGWEYSFTLAVPDQFNYCSIYT